VLKKAARIALRGLKDLSRCRIVLQTHPRARALEDIPVAEADVESQQVGYQRITTKKIRLTLRNRTPI
jgi:hypothetical protein